MQELAGIVAIPPAKQTQDHHGHSSKANLEAEVCKSTKPLLPERTEVTSNIDPRKVRAERAEKELVLAVEGDGKRVVSERSWEWSRRQDQGQVEAQTQ